MTDTYLTDSELSAIDLPKWPGCDVDGDPVTPEQADEIIVRTHSTYFFSNEKGFRQLIEDIFYTTIPYVERGRRWWDYQGQTSVNWRQRYEQVEAYRSAMGVIDLAYLSNERACSSYVGGPHGWCDWDGTIRQRNKNIGKWPSTTTILEEWSAIAQAFPFLRLTCRLLAHEAGLHEEAGFQQPRIIVVYEVSDGSAKARLPREGEQGLVSGAQPEEEDICSHFIAMLRDPSAERGVTPERWHQACQRTAQAMGALSTPAASP